MILDSSNNDAPVYSSRSSSDCSVCPVVFTNSSLLSSCSSNYFCVKELIYSVVSAPDLFFNLSPVVKFLILYTRSTSIRLLVTFPSLSTS
jgi:hypothetical protein